jgi:hypothetical protein
MYVDWLRLRISSFFYSISSYYAVLDLHFVLVWRFVSQGLVGRGFR